MEEQWKDIIIEKNGIIYDYTGLYQVSNLGRVKSLGNDKTRKEKILKPKINNNGYLKVGLYKNGKVKIFLVHRLVATAFIPNPDNLPVVNHRDENPSNNSVENLEWCTAKYNINYGTRNERVSEKHTGAKNPRARKVICLETKQIFGCAKDAEQWCGKIGVGRCCRGITRTCGGCHWQFLEDYRREQRKQSDINNSRLAA